MIILFVILLIFVYVCSTFAWDFFYPRFRSQFPVITSFILCLVLVDFPLYSCFFFIFYELGVSA